MKNFQEWVLYDGDCRFCLGWVERLGPWLQARGIGLAPLQSEWVKERLKLSPDKLLDEMRVISKTNQVFGGGDALLYLIKPTWWGGLINVFSYIPGIKPLIRWGYRWIAKRRQCLSGACRLPDHSQTSALFSDGLGWLPLLLLPAGSFLLRSLMPAWAFMWVLSITIYGSLKWLTLWNHRNLISIADMKRPLGYLLLWPGMDAENFLNPGQAGSHPTWREWLFAIGKTVFGGLVFWIAARQVPDYHPLVQGWIGLLGLAFLLHFGAFHMLSLFWREQGIDARPLMKNPLGASSLGDFWGHRWNLAFNTLAHRLTFNPLHGRLGTAGAMFAAFGVSGLIHDLVISVPAGGGYGCPTLYFLLQAGGISLERTSIGRKAGLRSGFPGWFFAMLLTAGPAWGLFHPPFIHRIIIPFMKAFGAL